MRKSSSYEQNICSEGLIRNTYMLCTMLHTSQPPLPSIPLYVSYSAKADQIIITEVCNSPNPLYYIYTN